NPARDFANQRARVPEDVVAEVHRAGSQGGHVRLVRTLERDRAAALVDAHPHRTAGGGLDQHVTPLSNLPNGLSEQLRRLRRGAVRISHVQVDQSGSLLARSSCVLGNFLGRDGQVRRLLSRRLRSDQRGGDHHRRIAHRFTLCFVFGTTQVPLALHTTAGSTKSSAADSQLSRSCWITFRASKRILRLVLPTSTISPSTSR